MKNLRIVLRKLAPNKIRVLGLLWLALVLAGLWYVSKYENTPGIAAAAAPLQFPDESSLKQTPGRPTLIMLVHPQCPCTRASIGELNLLMAQTQEHPATVYALFLKPEGFADAWTKTDTWQTASEIPGVKVVEDLDGKEAQLFSGATSGQTFLYDADGKLLFRGGITSARGHAGDNDGRTAIVRLLNGEQPAQTETAVYGCPLSNKDACPMHQ